MWKFLTLVTVTVLVIGAGAADQQYSRTETIRMTSFRVSTRTETQARAFKNFINLSSGQYFLRSGKIEQNGLTEIFVPINMERRFRNEMDTSRIPYAVHYEKAKLKLYGTPNNNRNANTNYYNGNNIRPVVFGDRSHPLSDSGIFYEVKSLPSQKLVSLSAFGTDNDAIIIYTNKGSVNIANQKWALKSAPGFVQDYRNWFNFVSNATGKCLTAGENKIFKGDMTPIVSYTCQSPYSESQMWSVEYDTQRKSSDPNDPTYFKLISKSGEDDKCLTANKSGEDMSQMFLLTCNNDDNQFFNYVDPNASN